MVEGFISSMPEAKEMLMVYPDMRTQLETVMGRPLQLNQGPSSTTVAPSLGGVAANTGVVQATGPNTVQAYVYDVSQGMAKGMSQMLLGKQIDLVPHTGIVVFGREYYFGSGPCVCDNPGQSVPVPVVQTMVLGETKRSRAELEAHVSGVLALEHNEQNYNLLTH